MKRILTVILALVLLCPSALADVDLTGMSFDELVALRDRIDLAIFSSAEWQQVEVPAGVWTIGEDIPEGHWTITLAYESLGNVFYVDRLDDFGKAPGAGWLGYAESLSTVRKKDGSLYDPSRPQSFDLEMKAGMYLINSSAILITPYAGKPDLSFK